MRNLIDNYVLPVLVGICFIVLMLFLVMGMIYLHPYTAFILLTLLVAWFIGKGILEK